MANQSTQLSKTISYALRHGPDTFGLELDSEGWVSIDDLVAALSIHEERWRDVTAADIRAIPAASSKQRFAIDGNKIRALYGHSLPDKLEMASGIPPEFLFHGTAETSLTSIRQSGLQPMDRQFVHMSIDERSAREVGLRRSKDPVILKIHAKLAFEKGCEFYARNEHIWLSNSIPPDFLEFPTGSSASS